MVFIQHMFADATRQRPALIAASLLFWVAWVGVFGSLQIGEFPADDAGTPLEDRLRGPAAPSPPAYTLASHPAVVPSPTRPATLRGQSRGGGQGSLPTAIGKAGTAFLAGHVQLSALPGHEPVRFRSTSRSPEHLPRPPPTPSEAG